MNESYLRGRTILLCRHGSHAYGLNTETSDIDEKGVCVLDDPSYYYGLKSFDQKDKGWEDGSDRQIFDVRKFVRLALACNPNIIEILYVDDDDILHITDLGRKLRDNRNLFLSKLAAKTFIGYAISQLDRMDGHKQWIDDPPEQPVEADFIKVYPLLPGAIWERDLSAHEIKVEAANSFKVMTPAVVTHYDRRAYDAMKKRWDKYIKWRENRNPTRKAMEDSFSFDGKHAMHLLRILRMGVEIIERGEVIVKRPDREELLDIRRGKYKYDDIIKQAREMRERINLSLCASPLPEEPDRNRAENLLMEIVERTLHAYMKDSGTAPDSQTLDAILSAKDDKDGEKERAE